MGYKLHRGRRKMFRKRGHVGKVLLGILLAAVIVAGGFFGTKYLMEHPVARPDDGSSTSGSSTPSLPDSSDDTPSQPDTVDVAQSVVGLYLPDAALHDLDALGATLAQAKAAGFDSVIFDMKDADGRLYFRSASEQAAQVDAFTETALTAEQLTALFDTIRRAGMNAVPRLFAFCDNAAARALPGARITPQGNPSWVWYDGVPGKGGKAWLNPYADEARLYVIGLARELCEAGATAVLFDGVQFPRQVSEASFGTSADANLSRAEILTEFITEARTLLGSEHPVLLACSGESALGEKTQVYGGNPLTFGADIAVPCFTPAATGEQTLREAVSADVHQCDTRIKVIEGDSPLLSPMLTVDGLTAEQLREVVDGRRESGGKALILYAADGKYDLSALAG